MERLSQIAHRPNHVARENQCARRNEHERDTEPEAEESPTRESISLCRTSGWFSPMPSIRAGRRALSSSPRGSNSVHIVTLVERQTRFAMLLKVPGKDTATVVAALGKHVSKLHLQSRRSLTWDRGKEMADHKNFTIATNVQVYFCDPRSPWQRGSNENTNGLLRQYFPRGKDLSGFSQAYLNKIALRLNQRPRKTLGFESPADRLQAVLH